MFDRLPKDGQLDWVFFRSLLLSGTRSPAVGPVARYRSFQHLTYAMKGARFEICTEKLSPRLGIEPTVIECTSNLN